MTGTTLEELLSDLGLKDHIKTKLTLSKVLEIGDRSALDEPAQSLKALPGCVLNRLMMANVTARSTQYTPSDEEASLNGRECNSLVKDLDNAINPLDIMTALFLCCDSFLQLELFVKMSMCQFAVPLLLPNCDTEKCTLMLWAMRDIIKKIRPNIMAGSSFIENSIVLADLPMVSFVRLGNVSVSKSQFLNKLLSNPQQYHDTFVHHDMECGDRPRRLSDGLVEISWYLPSGKKNIDIFTEPLAVANLRGDVRSFETQYRFLCQTSAAVFVFFEDFELSPKYFTVGDMKAQLFVIISQGETLQHDSDALQKMAAKCKIQSSNLIVKTTQNDTNFVKNVRTTVRHVIEKSPHKMRVEEMSGVAHELGILVDEDHDECQRAKQKADEITCKIKDTVRFKETQLPLQGEIWKELSQLEKEKSRLRQAGDQEIEHYKSSLEKKERELREKQRGFNMTEAMSSFITGMSVSGIERSYFLKWMRINLDNLSRKSLSGLREKYKEYCKTSGEKKEMIVDLDEQISNSSLGTEHFLREMGQLYESACSISDNSPGRKQIQDLPKFGAQMLLDGFPLELVDGDASNIPIKWISEVLSNLHSLVNSNTKIRVVTVLGVQSTGKSTLLNTMFGVQFAVSSGRCTRGAFMLLIRVKDKFREQLGCDFLMVIDTEGLKSPELAQLADSYEHDNELATLVVGLSDITIINIAMENSTDMKDILQIVVHAFLRMKEVGKKPCCQFVHQNVADVSARDNNLRGRKVLLEQLDEMTQAAARMEKRGDSKFTDVMNYDPEKNTWYIPGLWHGNPPMAAVSTGYSEAVNELKSSVIEALKELKETRPAHTFPEFLKWTRSLWTAVKCENFIFSFQNSLVAEAYTKLCKEFNRWDWTFRKHMYNWVIEAVTKVSNFDTETLTAQYGSNMDELLTSLKNEGTAELDKSEKQILKNTTEYFKKKDGHVYLVEKYKQEFMNSAKNLRREMQNTVVMKLESAVDNKKGMASVESIKKRYKTIMEQQVLQLLDYHRTEETQMSDKQLEMEFEKMWKKTMESLSVSGLQRQNVVKEIRSLLESNLKTKAGTVHERLSKVTHLEECGKEPFIISHVDRNYLVRLFNNYINHAQTKKMQEMSDSIINKSRKLIANKLETRTDFQKIYMLELLGMIDEHLENHRHLQLSDDFEASLKIHICGHAAREFQQMHNVFISDNDPQKCLEKFKNQFCNDFMDLFHKREQCQRKAQEFTSKCLKPAVREYITNALGVDLMDELIKGTKSINFSTRSFYQFSILKELLIEENFEMFVRYISKYEDFVKEWIFNEILEHFSRESSIAQLEARYLKQIIRKIKAAVDSAQRKAGSGNLDICMFIRDICNNLSELLVIPRDALDAVTLLIKAKSKQFPDWLLSSIDEMEQSLSAEYHSNKDVKKRLDTLPFKPQDELFRRVFGCGKQCPFCMAPCEAGGEGHLEHFTSIHRPEGLGSYRWEISEILSTDICSSCVASEGVFCSSETKGEYHSYKDYQKFYPDWRIQPDTSIQATAYWKYVFAKFNTQFAMEYKAEPADLPPDWKSITKEKAMESLEERFMMKTQNQ
ncbi:up-regulator of cell proliferation-like [Megalops cyprinoides]|uniref:up-regulator of cell proliferation-like n=1 Tax=Megalops cyprinoides TaxID=118141 RepID=UPI0018641969|nr:up-regulator of cell proliferation-like [Megalops cyprinoides]